VPKHMAHRVPLLSGDGPPRGHCHCRITSVKISPLVDDRMSSDRRFVDLCGVAILSHGVLYACADDVISDL